MAVKSGVYKKGEVLLMQGEPSLCFYYLQKGAVEILSSSGEYAGLDKRIILEHSVRVSLVNEPTFVGGAINKTLRVVEDCEVQCFTMDGGFARFALDDPGRAVLLLTHLFRRVECAVADLSKFHKLYQSICVVSDNIALMSQEVSAGELPERIEQRAENLHETYKKNGTPLPKNFDHQFILADRSAAYKKKYAIPGEPIENIIDRDMYAFLKRFVKIDRNIFAHLVKADPEIGIYIFNKIQGYLSKTYERVASVYDSVDEEMELLFASEDSWTRYLADYGALRDWERGGRLSQDFSRNLFAIFSKIYSVYTEISGKDISSLYPGLSRFKEFLSQAQARASQGIMGSSSRPATSGDYSNVGRLYESSMQQIFEFAVAPNDFRSMFIRSLNEFKKMNNPFSPDDDARKIRRQMTKLYWQLYSQVYIRSLKEKQLPSPVKLMLLFGFVDEKLIDDDQIGVLHALSQSSEQAQIPIMYECEFLMKLNNGDEMPSLNEVGITYEKHIREEMEKAGKAGRQIDESDPLRKVDYEIMNRLQSTVGICAGSRSTAFPILTSHLIKGNPESFYSSKRRIAAIISEVLSIDYSAFYRETVTKLNEPVIFEEEILPYFIILPSFGTKTMMWQEIVGTNKRSRARIVIPAFFMGDLRRSLAHSFASFRWEICRSLQGAMWADPVEGGLTGAYYDYVQFARKNSKLSPEAREKLHERLKGVRNNMKELFCEDYIMWVLFEREGTMKLNGVVRDIFYRFIPFKKELREHLETMPAFVELASKFKNVRTRKIREYENKFKKYRDATGNLPPALQQFMNYLRL
jgi:hypothetical protein